LRRTDGEKNVSGGAGGNGSEGKREPLSRERIVAAAIALVDRDGWEALSMRRLGTELGGYEAMSLYRYFDSKAELVDAVVEGVWSQMSLPEDEPDPWERLRKLSWSWRSLAHAHPNVFPLLAGRAPQSPGAMRPMAFTFRTFRDAGFDEEHAGHAFFTAVGFVYGYTLQEFVAASNPNFDVSRVPEEFGAIVELARYQGTRDRDRTFEWGLRVTIQGLRDELSASKARRTTQKVADEKIDAPSRSHAEGSVRPAGTGPLGNDGHRRSG
jgi:AcrR family transcriptional regulator